MNKVGREVTELSIAVTKEEHQMFTSEWRRLIPYGEGTLDATAEKIYNTARDIYRDYPEILEALNL